MNTKEIATQIGDIKSLQDYADPLQKAVRAAIQGEFKNFLHGTWLGHPLHPVLTDIPVGAWTAAQVLDNRISELSRTADTGHKINVE